jgi:hypothetical protein
MPRPKKATGVFADAKLDFDAAVEADAKLMKHVDDWPPFVAWAYDQIDKVLKLAGRDPLDREALRAPGDYFDNLVDAVKATKPTSLKAQFIKSAILVGLEYVHKFIHPEHVEAGA